MTSNAAKKFKIAKFKIAKFKIAGINAEYNSSGHRDPAGPTHDGTNIRPK